MSKETSTEFVPGRRKVGKDPLTGLDQIEYNFKDHPGMQGDDVTKHSHVLMMTGIIPGSLTMGDGTEYDVTPTWIAVHVDHADELEVALHRLYHASGLTTVAPPEKGQLQLARDAFVAAGFVPPVD